MYEKRYELVVPKPDEMSVEEYYDNLGKAFESLGRYFRHKSETETVLAISTSVGVPELNAVFTIEHREK